MPTPLALVNSDGSVFYISPKPMKTEPMKETTMTPIHSIQNSLALNAAWLRSLAREKADAKDFKAAALLQELSDSLSDVVDELKEVM